MKLLKTLLKMKYATISNRYLFFFYVNRRFRKMAQNEMSNTHILKISMIFLKSQIVL